MNKLEKVNQLISYLLEASPEYLPYCEQHPKNYTPACSPSWAYEYPESRKKAYSCLL